MRRMANPWVSALLGIGIGLVSQFLPSDYPTWVRDLAFRVGIALVIWGFALWTYKALRRPHRPLPAGHETDAAIVLHYLLHETKWAEREHRQLNFRSMVHHLAEFRRAARDDGLQTSGLPKFGGPPENIDSRYWDGAEIDRDTAGIRGGVCSKQFVRQQHLGRYEFSAIKVRTADYRNIWPRATFAGRWVTRAYVGAKKVYYWWSGERERAEREWHRINNNVREGIPLATAVTLKPWPDFDRWDEEGIFRLFEAACLWCDESPSLPLNSGPSHRFEQLRDAIYCGDLQGYLSLQESVRSAWAKHNGRPEPADDPITVNSRVKRAALTDYAMKIGERPRFLFPGARSA